MARWDIDPAGVRAVVTRTAAVADDFEAQAGTYAARLTSAVQASGSQLVGQALIDFATHNERAFAGAMERTARVLGGAVAATKAYLAGDLEMAEQAQRNATAATAPDSGPPRGPGGGPR